MIQWFLTDKVCGNNPAPRKGNTGWHSVLQCTGLRVSRLWYLYKAGHSELKRWSWKSSNRSVYSSPEDRVHQKENCTGGELWRWSKLPTDGCEEPTHVQENTTTRMRGAHQHSLGTGRVPTLQVPLESQDSQSAGQRPWKGTLLCSKE